ncbi:HIT-like domain [Dillenia turbinata]|uniref:HIT-like domain n=1 Tax=Dillenia turbinata TaxID=194707 RepID=A0AAN8W5V2_9MAGN
MDGKRNESVILAFKGLLSITLSIFIFQMSQLREIDQSVVATMCSKVPHISKAIMKATDCESVHDVDSFNLLVNSGAAAGQVIFHTHIHIIPRKKFDCLWASEGLRRHSLKLDREASGLADRIRQELNNSEDINQGSSSSRTYCKL